MWNVKFEQTCVPVLHVILGIAKKLFDVMVAEVQDIYDTCPEQKEIKDACEFLQYFVTYKEE